MAEAAGLAPFERELGRLDAADLTPEALRRALASLAQRGHAAASVPGVLSTWRGLCLWLVVSGHLASDPTIGIKGPKRPEPRPKLLECLLSGVRVV